MRVVLAPMEGVLDHLMRDLLTQVGGYDLCVTEFVRVVDQVISDKGFYRLCPELKDAGVYGCTTKAGTPVRVQLLGQEPDYLAENAVKAIELGSQGIDLNFGCPAKTVNKSRGGAILLKDPENLYRIISAVKAAVPHDAIVSAKMRLGYEDKTLAIENAQAIESAGANELTIHARTKVEGYKPPAHWQWIAKIKEQVNLPIIANGEIWDLADAQQCRAVSNCSDIMVGRGALAVPNLAKVIKQEGTKMPWQDVRLLLAKYTEYETYGAKSKYYPNRIKQWLKYLKLQYVEADELFQEIRTLKTAEAIQASL
ncbi:tRNA dihydrouridine(16) synthase DusC [Litorilituus lipolyticus]|uniref:tRNA-dihydrouridine(16) synthase n=1 Tax=Litorilituus lipolyticus TaxID=2491017 RepID=A0A502KVK3_9GAMM|nr:tRNA dihydrouridine(16) synthase DusC [Litorilituus lipolyticus]TPH15134.1 tRNA dihydrouridine(16) synthase DusC [Litorilituus lipolyticus]